MTDKIQLTWSQLCLDPELNMLSHPPNVSSPVLHPNSLSTPSNSTRMANSPWCCPQCKSLAPRCSWQSEQFTCSKASGTTTTATATGTTDGGTTTTTAAATPSTTTTTSTRGSGPTSTALPSFTTTAGDNACQGQELKFDETKCKGNAACEWNPSVFQCLGKGEPVPCDLFFQEGPCADQAAGQCLWHAAASICYTKGTQIECDRMFNEDGVSVSALHLTVPME